MNPLETPIFTKLPRIPDFLEPNMGSEAISFCLDKEVEGSSYEIDAVSDIEGGVYLWRSDVTKTCQKWPKLFYLSELFPSNV
jgi:hypothetical protein